jgi:AcrR family transcriptional regulator
MPGTSRVRSAEDSRARILDAAEGLFAEEGYDGTPTSRVAERAGVYKGLVFHYFARKIDLLLALVDRVPIDQIASLEAEVVPGDVAATLLNVAADFDVWYTRRSAALSPRSTPSSSTSSAGRSTARSPTAPCPTAAVPPRPRPSPSPC